MIHHDHCVSHVGVFAITESGHVMHNHHHHSVDVGVFAANFNNKKFHTSIYNSKPKSRVAMQATRKMIPNLFH
jgi:hypothetical protein